MIRWTAGFPLVLVFWASAIGADPPAERFDTVRLRNGMELQGLVLAEERHTLAFKRVMPLMGRRLWTSDWSFDLVEIERLDKVPPAERKALQERIRQAEAAEDLLKKRRAELRLTPVGPSGTRWLFEGNGFKVTADVRESLLRELIPTLEDLFTTFAKQLPARDGAPRLSLVLSRQVGDYQAWQKAGGVLALNPAHFDPRRGELHAWLELDRLAGELEKVRAAHAEKEKQAEGYLAKLKSHFEGKPPLASLLHVRSIRLQMQTFDVENQIAFQKEADAALRLLAHEAMQGWLQVIAEPPASGAWPRWWVEGLGQVAEGSILGGQVEWGRRLEPRWQAVQEQARTGSLWPIAKLLTADPRGWNVNDHRAGWEVDRGFLTAYAASQYLAIESRLLGTGKLSAFLAAPPEQAVAEFEKLVGEPVEKWERKLLAWIAATERSN